jgi:uncharacterized protein
MFLRIIRSCRDIIAICDEELVGKSFEEGNSKLEIKESFYCGEKKDQNETIEILKDFQKEDATFNIVGKEAVSCAIKAKIIKENQIKFIQGIPYSLVLL